MRGLTSTILLVVVLAGLGAYIYFVDSERPAGGIEEKQKVFTVDSDTVEEIRLTSENETSVLRKTEGTWRMVEPVAADVDQQEVSNLTSSLSTLEVNEVVDENAADLTRYGLAQPRITLAFKGEGGAAGEIHLGRKTVTQSDMYAVKAGEKRVFLVSAFQESTFAKKPFDLRDKRVLNFERDKVDAVEVVAGGSPIQLARTGSEWVVKAPVQARGDYGTIEGLLTRLSSTNMTKLIDPSAPPPASGNATPAKPATPGDPLAAYGLDKPQATVTLGAGSTRAVLSVGKEEDGAAYARDHNRNLLFTIDPTVVADLKKPIDDYRDKDIFEFRGFNADRVRIARGAETYEFQKVKGTGETAADKWQRVSQGGAPADVDTAKMEDLLNKLSNIRAQSFNPTLQGTGLDKPALTVSASYDNGKFERGRLTKTGDNAFGAREGEPGAAKLDAAAYDEMLKALDAVLAPPTPPTPAAKQ